MIVFFTSFGKQGEITMPIKTKLLLMRKLYLGNVITLYVLLL